MAAHVVVIDTAFRRANIKVTPQTHLSDVLELACQKLSLRSENYALKCVLQG
jgi:tether containing UBX domain for GLUT4